MGASSSKAQPVGVLVLGLDNAGKSSLLASVLEPKDARTVMPTLGFMVRGLRMADGTQLKVWDVGGRRDVREHWRAHYHKVKAIIYVIDSVDRHRLQENSVELRRLLDQPQLVGLPLLLLANKQDVAGALPRDEVRACLHLHTIRDRVWTIKGCSAFSGSPKDRLWKELTEAEREGAIDLGYDQRAWNAGEVPEECSRPFQQLDAAAQAAAQALGYSQKTWEAEQKGDSFVSGLSWLAAQVGAHPAASKRPGSDVAQSERSEREPSEREQAEEQDEAEAPAEAPATRTRRRRSRERAEEEEEEEEE
jgi:ADP-ribosylation factor-like protein 3